MDHTHGGCSEPNNIRSKISPIPRFLQKDHQSSDMWYVFQSNQHGTKWSRNKQCCHDNQIQGRIELDLKKLYLSFEFKELWWKQNFPLVTAWEILSLRIYFSRWNQYLSNALYEPSFGRRFFIIKTIKTKKKHFQFKGHCKNPPVVIYSILRQMWKQLLNQSNLKRKVYAKF